MKIAGISTVSLGGAGRTIGTVSARQQQGIEIGSVNRIDANSEAGFNYPYFIFAPSKSSDAESKPILAQSNNTGTPTDEFQRHLDSAKQDVRESFGRQVADSLDVPYLIPVFPRPLEEPVDWHHYVHQLDRDTLAIEDGPLARVDLQFLRMIEDARQRLRDKDYPVADGVMLNGFSASANFVERFATLHPDEVVSVTAGGVNGMPILPLSETVGHTLKYHVGTADIESLTGDPVDMDAVTDVNRFLYMGEFDSSDTIPFPDAWTSDDLRQIALDVYGQHMVYDRFSYAKSVYDDVGTNAVFRVYRGAKHTPRPAKGHVVEFHQRSLNGEAGADIRGDLGGNVPELGAHVEYGPRDPETGESISFGGSRSALNSGSIQDYEWTFNGGSTATGETAEQSLAPQGGHAVRLAVTDDAGQQDETVEPVEVHDQPNALHSRVRVLDQPQVGDETLIVEYTVDQAASSASRLRISVYGRELSYATLGHVRPGDTRARALFHFKQFSAENEQLQVAIFEPGERPSRDQASDRSIAYTKTQVGSRQQTQDQSGFSPELIDANPDAGFNYPYFLMAPDRSSDENPSPLLVQPNNTGTSTDDFARHRRAARRVIEGGFGPVLADGLSAPFLVPVFPRPRSEPVDFTHYVHALDDTTMGIGSGPLERVDLQLLRMAEDARARLRDRGYPVADGLMLNGFSAAGNFAERFAALHPEEVVSVTAGGVNGMPILPRESAAGQTLNYPVGVANVEELTGEPFNLDAFRRVNRFLFMGEIDMNDTIPFGDAWTSDELRQTALDVYGRDMHEERFPYSRAVYDAVDANAVFRMYEETGHDPRPAYADILDFHRRSMAGEDIASIRADLGRNVPNLRAAIERTPRDPMVGDQVAVYATATQLRDATPTKFEWEIGDGTTASGKVASHVFEDAGTYPITLTVTDDAGNSHTATDYVRVEGRANQAAEPTPTPTRTTATQTTAAQGDNAPPEAEFIHDPSTPEKGAEVLFNASDSRDPDGEIVSYEWDFGDGATATGERVMHTYTEGGYYDVTLTVRDNDGATDSTQQEISVVLTSPPGEAGETSSPTATEGQPGLGIKSTVLSLGGVAYLLNRWIGTDDRD